MLPAYRTATAAALDAADGVIDGRYFGRPIIETNTGLSSSVTRQYLGGGGYYSSGLGSSVTRRYLGGSGYYSSGYISPSRRYYGASQVYSSGPSYVSSTAAALDAADGVMDGKYFGRPIIETTGYSTGYSTGYTLPRPPSASVTRVEVRQGRPYSLDDSVIRRQYYGGYRPASVTRYAYDDSSISRRYLNSGGYSSTGYRPAYQSSTALALDAADGVIDGRYFGRPIIETSAPTTHYGGYYGSSLAARLDAADGVIDGKYFGRPIITL